MDDVHLKDAKLSFCFLPHLIGSVFENCEFGQSKFLLADIKNVKFIDCSIHDTFFNACTFEKVLFTQNETLFKPTVIDSKFKEVNFSDISIYSSKFLSCEFSLCYFENSEIVSSTFTGSSFDKIDFKTSLMGSCDFRAAGLHQVKFLDIVTGSKFSGCNNEFEWFKYRLKERLNHRLEQPSDLSSVEHNQITFSKCEFDVLNKDACEQILSVYNEIKVEHKDLKELQVS